MAVNRVQRADGTVELDVTGVTAGAADVLAGKKFVGADGVLTDGAMPSVTQATPSITVSSAGLITASATQAAGKVAAGTKSATKQLTTQGAKTWTPGIANQTIAAGQYLTGAQTIKGDANLVAANIKKGASIFGVAGSAEVAGTESVVTGTLTRENSEQIVISGLSFSKIKAVYLAAYGIYTTSYEIGIASVILQDGKYFTYQYESGNAIQIYQPSGGAAAISYTYSNGTLTINAIYPTFNVPHYGYVIIGE